MKKTTPYCSSLICPRLRTVELPDRVPSHELSQDSSGHSWCNYCEKQRLLMDWASDNRWQGVRVQGKMRYAVDAGAESWLMSIVGGNHDMIDALHETLIENKRAQLQPLEER